MANDGEIHALKKQIAKQSECIQELGKELGDMAVQLSSAQNVLRALKNPDMLMDGMPLTLDRIQVMENGDIRRLPPPPEMTCIEEVTKEFGKNGKKDKEAVLASDPA
jgi:uncharacterized coiled-coil protein SlyX